MQLVAGNHVTLLRNGTEFFPALESAINAAQHEIHLQTYIYEIDNVGQRIADALIRASSRGVNVFLMLDGFGCKDLPKRFIASLRHAGIQVLIYGPKISPWTLERNRLRRMHRKVAVIDGRIGFVGGINIVDDYNTPGHTPPRVDYAVKIEGMLLPAMHKSAVALWRYVNWVSLKRKIKLDSPSHAPRLAGQMDAAYVVRDNILHRRDIENAYLDAIRQAKEEIIIVNAYFLPGLRFRRALYRAAQRGVRVKLVLQARVEYWLMDMASRALYSAFLQHGIEIFEYHKSFMHSKVAVVDGVWATVGSSNIDPFSLLLAREANVVVENQEFAQILKQDIQNAIANGSHRVTLNDWCSHHKLRRMFAWLVYGLVRLMMGLAGYQKHR